MKKNFILLTATGILFLSSCKKENSTIESDNTTNSTTSITGTSPNSKGGGNNGGGGTTFSGFISFIGGTIKLIGGHSDSIQINLAQPAPATGWSLSLSSSNPAVQIPPAFAVTAGTQYVHVPITSSIVNNTTSVTITASLLGQSKTSRSFEVFPLHANFASPKLQSPGNGSGFKNRLLIKFTWSDNSNAYYHDLQISDSPAFSSAYLDEVYLDNPIWAQSYFNGLDKRYWRVRFIDASGTPGPWSEVRNFEIKQ